MPIYKHNSSEDDKTTLRNMFAKYGFSNVKIKYEKAYTSNPSSEWLHSQTNAYHSPYYNNIEYEVREIATVEVDVKSLTELSCDLAFMSQQVREYQAEEFRQKKSMAAHPQVKEAYDKYMTIYRLYS